jgi:DNA invertase Pin-like site-specific DNA recombinase
MRKRNPDVSRLVTELQAAAARRTPEQRAALQRSAPAFRAVVPSDVDQLIEEMTSPLPDKAIAQQMVLDLRQAIRVGFVLAVVRYRRELKANKEAMAIIAARSAGGHKGRITQTKRTQDRRTQVQSMLNDGIDVPEIAKALGCSASTVYRLSQPAPQAKASKEVRRR